MNVQCSLPVPRRLQEKEKARYGTVCLVSVAHQRERINRTANGSSQDGGRTGIHSVSKAKDGELMRMSQKHFHCFGSESRIRPTRPLCCFIRERGRCPS